MILRDMETLVRIREKEIGNFFEDRAGRIAFRREQILGLVAGGMSRNEIARQLGMSPNTVRDDMTDLSSAFSSKGRVNTVLTAIKEGKLNIGNLTKGFKKELIQTLSGREVEVLDALIDSDGANSSTREIASKLEIREKTVKNSLTKIKHRLRIKGRVRLAVCYLWARDMQSRPSHEN